MDPSRARGEPAVLVWRGRVLESVHCAIVAAAGPEGGLVARLGDPSQVVVLRSAAKPFQALALVESGAADAFGLAEEELAVIAGSHGGEDRHVQAVEAILAKGGLGVEALKCGVHRPYHGPTAERLGDKATPLHHNCSGKHAGMLLLAKHLGEAPARYLEPASAGQRRIRATLARAAGLRPREVRVATDGCSAPTLALPLRGAAVAFARLAAPERSPVSGEGLARVRDAMLHHPGMVAGEGRFDTALIETFRGAAVSKSGAEGVQGVGVLPRALGLAVKVVDGAPRAVPPLVLEAMRQLRAATRAHEEALEPHMGRVLRNWAGREVGRLEARFRLRRARGAARDR